jgi:tetratricopeptide (TPR) repeat protein
MMWRMMGRTEKITKHCPFCRVEIGKPVAQNALIQARMYLAQACQPPYNKDDTERMKLLSMALAECDMVLETNDRDLDALKIKVRTLAQFNPSETVKIVKYMFHVHMEAEEKLCRYRKLAEQVLSASASSDDWFSEELFEELDGAANIVPYPQSLGSRPDALFEWRLELAKAYENLNQWQDAFNEYDEMHEWYEASQGKWKRDQDDLRRIHTVTLGYTRCMFEWGNLDEALRSSQHALRMDRTFEGVHRLIAKVQRSLARRPTVTPNSLPGMTNTISCSMADAVETMHRGVIYETPWDEDNQRVNREFLQELLVEIENEPRGRRSDKLSDVLIP